MSTLTAILIVYLAGFVLVVALLLWQNRKVLRTYTPQRLAQLKGRGLHPMITKGDLALAGLIWPFVLLMLCLDWSKGKLGGTGRG